jgi:hypothetical protein
MVEGRAGRELSPTALPEAFSDVSSSGLRPWSGAPQFTCRARNAHMQDRLRNWYREVPPALRQPMARDVYVKDGHNRVLQIAPPSLHTARTPRLWVTIALVLPPSQIPSKKPQRDVGTIQYRAPKRWGI